MSTQMNRRSFLRYSALAAGTGLLAACTVPPAGVTQPAAVATGAAAANDPWLTGLVPPDLAADFRMMSWEGEGEMRKWLLHINKFFNTYYPSVKQTIDWGIDWNDYWTKLATLLAGGSPLEMVWMHDSRVKTFASRDFLTPLDDYLAAYVPPGWPEEFYKSQVEAFKWNGKQYAFPYDWAPGGFYINQDLFDQAGLKVPDENATWDEILDLALKLTHDVDDPQKATWGLGQVGTTTWSAGHYWIVKSFGGDYWTPDLTKSMMADPKTVQAFQFIRDLEWKYKVQPSAAMVQGLGMDMESAFVSGKIAMHYGLNDLSFRFGEAIGDKFKWTVAPTPTGPAGRFQFSGGSAWCIPATCTQKDLAYELIRYVLSDPETPAHNGYDGRGAGVQHGLRQVRLAARRARDQRCIPARLHRPRRARCLLPRLPREIPGVGIDGLQQKHGPGLGRRSRRRVRRPGQGRHRHAGDPGLDAEIRPLGAGIRHLNQSQGENADTTFPESADSGNVSRNLITSNTLAVPMGFTAETRRRRRER